MGRQSLPQRQLLTVRQILIALGIVACLAFIVSYSSRIILNSKVQEQNDEMAEQVLEQREFKQEISSWLQDMDNPSRVEAYARNELNWELPGDQAVATLRSRQNARSEPIAPELTAPDLLATPEPKNWQMWLDLVVSGDIGRIIDNEIVEDGTISP